MTIVLCLFVGAFPNIRHVELSLQDLAGLFVPVSYRPLEGPSELDSPWTK